MVTGLRLRAPGWRQQCPEAAGVQLPELTHSGGSVEQDTSQGTCAASLQQCTGCSVRAQHVAGSFTGLLKQHLLELLQELPQQLTVSVWGLS